MTASPLSPFPSPLLPPAPNGLSSSIIARVDAVLATLSRNYPESGPEGTPPSSVPSQHSSTMALADITPPAASVQQDTVASPSMAAAPLPDEVAPPSMAANPLPRSSLPGTDAAAAQLEGTSQEDRADDLRKLREERLSSYAGHLLLCRLTESEWKQFEAHVDRLVSDLALLVPSRRPTHPSTYWRRRRRTQTLSQRNDRPTLSSQPLPRCSTPDRAGERHATQQDPLVSSQTSQQPTSQDDPIPDSSSRLPSHRRRTAQGARKIQRWYRTNKGRCMRSILGEQSPPCEIPAATLREHFDVPAKNLDGESPSPCAGLHPPTPNHSDGLTSTVTDG